MSTTVELRRRRGFLIVSRRIDLPQRRPCSFSSALPRCLSGRQTLPLVSRLTTSWMPVVASTAGADAMSNHKGDVRRRQPSSNTVRYTFVLLNERGDWRDIQSIYAVDDAEALAMSKFLAKSQPFEVWLGFRCLGVFSGTEH